MQGPGPVAAADPTAKPVLLGLTGPGGLGAWAESLSALRAFLLVEAHDLEAAAALAQGCRPDLLLLDPAGFGALPPDCRDRFPASPLGRRPVVILAPPDRAPRPGPAVEDILSPDLPAGAAAIRLRAVLRRRRPTSLTARLRWDAVEVRQDERIVIAAGRLLRPSHPEFNLLALMVEDPGRAWSRAELRRALWGCGEEDRRALDRVVQGLRRQLAGALGRDPIAALRGTGYRLVPSP